MNIYLPKVKEKDTRLNSNNIYCILQSYNNIRSFYK